MSRVFLIVLDSFGIGYEPDAAEFGDVGANTLGSVYKSEYFKADNMIKLGLFNIDGVRTGKPIVSPEGTYGRLMEQSRGKDTTVGHWEIAGIISRRPLPVYPNGFPDEVIREFERQTGRKVLCNKPFSGTEVIAKYGKEHIDTGALIVYTSADSVFQVAAHEDVVPVQELYKYCEMARKILTGEHGVGRVIARPFTGSEGNYKRTVNRHDFSLEPPHDTMLDELKAAGFDTISIGKIIDIFAGKGIEDYVRTVGNTDGMNKTMDMLERDFNGICFTNLVDYDMLYGHRNDVDGYAKAISEFDIWLGKFMEKLGKDDIIMITADHGCDPGYPGSNHTREYIPFLAYGQNIKSNSNIGTRKTYADIGKTITDIFGVGSDLDGESFKNELLRH